MEVDGAVPELEFVDACPRGGLRELVGSMVGYRTTGQEPSLHRGAPSPYLTFIVNLDTPIVTGTHPGADADGTTRAYDNILAGLHTRPAYLFQPERQAGIQLAIDPLASRRVFGMPASELDQLGDDATDVLGAGVRRLQERAVNGGSWVDRFDLVHQFLLDRVERAPTSTTPRREVVAAWRWMVAHRGAGRMDDLAAHVAMSSRQLAKLFHNEVGVPPKAVNRLIRFDRARREIQRPAVTGERLGLTTVAHWAGYFDHAHLSRDFRALLGCSPTEWLAEEFENIQAGNAPIGEESAA